MTDLAIGTDLNDIQVETSFTPAPVEQQSTETPVEQPVKEMVTTEPKEESVTEEPVKDTKVVEPNKDAAARQAIQDRIRADEAERKLKALQPKVEVPEQMPDINDQKTWGAKYKDQPNDLETFLKARDEWAMAQGTKQANERIQQENAAKALEKQRVEIATRDQAARVKYTDYDAVIQPIIPILTNVPILKDFVTRNAMGSEVAYELGRNPAVLQQLLQSPDVWAAGEQLLAMAARLKAPKPIEITQAPEPIKPVGSRETAKPKLPELASKDVNGYIAEMNKRELARKRH